MGLGEYRGTSKTLREQRADWENHHIEGYARAAVDSGQIGYFSAPLISEVEPGLWVGGCLDAVRLPDDFTHVISLYKWERYTLGPKTRRIEVTMYDGGEVPDVDQLNELADLINEYRRDGKVLVHCQAGLNRSNLVTALALIKSGMAPKDAIKLLREKRSPMVLCNQAFENWLLGLGESQEEETELIKLARQAGVLDEGQRSDGDSGE